MKLTVGSVSMDGAFVLSRTFDSIGVMAKSTQDVALLASALLNSESQQSPIGQEFKTPHTSDWKGITVAFSDCSVWEDPTMVITLGSTYTKLSKLSTLETRVRICNFTDWESRGFCCLSTRTS